MAKFHTGEIVIDQYLQIVKADEKFYEHVGSQNYSSLLSSIHPDDLPALRETILRLEPETAARRLLFRMTTGGEYHYVLAEISQSFVEDDMLYYSIHLQDLDTLEKELADICDENQIFNEYVGLLGDILFLYDISEDALKVYTGGQKNKVYLFRGSLDQFRQVMWDHGAVTEEYKDTFDAFCRNLKNGTKSFEHKLLLLDKSINPEVDMHLIKGRTIVNSKGGCVVLGCILLKSIAGDIRMDGAAADTERDITTGLLSKKAVIEYAKNLLNRRPKHKVNICIIDIDNFKQVNDTLGHMFGDEVLATVADILKDAVVDKGVAGRIGGDEMMLVLEGINEFPDLKGVLRSIRSNVEWAYKERKEVPRVTCSMGVSTYPADGDNYDELFQIADKMLYRAKEKGKNRYIIYEPEVHGSNILQKETVQDLAYKGGTKQDKEDFVLYMLEYLGHQMNRPFNMLFQDIGNSFELDGIHMFYGSIGKVTLENFWEPNLDGELQKESSIEFVREENFHHLYKEHGMAVIDNFGIIEELCPRTYAYMITHNIKAALIYKMNCQKHEGYIAYYKKSESTRKWSDSDRAGLTYISKILELIINDR